MARKYVLSKVSAAAYNDANVALCSIVGDTEGTIEMLMNASVDGNEPATHSICNINLSQSQANAWTTWLASTEGCDGKIYPISPPTDFWAEAWNWWSLQRVANA